MMTTLAPNAFRRVWLGVGLPAVMVLIAFGPWLLVAGDVPHPLAVRFGVGSRANGSMPIWAFVALQLAFCGPCVAILVRAGRRLASVPPMAVVTATFVGITTGWIWASVLLANDGHHDWHTVTLGIGAVLGAWGSAIGFTIPVGLMVRRAGTPAAATPTPPLPLGRDDRAVWFGRTHSTGFLVAGVVEVLGGGVLVVMSVAGRVGAAVGVSVVLVVIGFVFLAFATVEVRVSDDGVRIRSGVFHRPVVRIRLADIERAQANDLRPTAWGGWGYRGSVRLFGRGAWILRSGEGLELALRGGKAFAVTVDHADEGAAVLNGILAHRVPASGS
jgi:hypothetical protein